MRARPHLILEQQPHGLCITAAHAASWWARAIGLLGTPRPPADGEGLLLDPGGAIHTIGMRYAIDVAFLDRDLRVLRVANAVSPNQIRCAPNNTRFCLETRSGALPSTLEGEFFTHRQGE